MNFEGEQDASSFYRCSQCYAFFLLSFLKPAFPKVDAEEMFYYFFFANGEMAHIMQALQIFTEIVPIFACSLFSKWSAAVCFVYN